MSVQMICFPASKNRYLTDLKFTHLFKNLIAILPWILVCLILMLLLTGCHNSNLSTLEPVAQDLGDIIQFEKKSFSIVLKNTSNEPIEITKADVSCGCTHLSVPKTDLGIHESVKIEGYLSAADRTEPFQSNITIAVKSKTSLRTDTHVVSVTGNPTTVLLKPGAVDLGNTLIGQNSPTQSFIISKGTADLNWNSLRIKDGLIHASIEALDPKNWKIIIPAQKSFIIGNHHYKLHLELWNVEQNHLVREEYVPINYNVYSGNFSLTPLGVYLSPGHQNRLTIRSRKDHVISVKFLEIPAESGVSYKISKNRDKIEIQFQVREEVKEPWLGVAALEIHDGLVSEKATINMIVQKGK